MKTYRIAMLGCRGRGTIAAQAYHAHPRCEVVGLCDLVPERLKTLGDTLGVSARFEDLDEMIRQTEPDIVAVPTATQLHYGLAMRVLEHGKVHIDVEKPMCSDLAQADGLLERAEALGARIAVHHQGRTGPALQAVARAFREGKIGALRHVSSSGKGYYGGYGLMNIGTHTINGMLEVTGHCRRVTASLLTDGRPITPEDVLPSPAGMGTIAGEHITAILEFEGGVTATHAQHLFPSVDSTAHSIELLGTEGRLYWHMTGAWWLPTPHIVPGKADWQALDMVMPDHYDPDSPASADDYLYAEDYVRALDEGRQHTCSGVEGRHVMEILLAIMESGAYRRPVELPQAGRDHPLLRWRKEAGLGEPAEMPVSYRDWLAAEGRRLGWDAGKLTLDVKRI